jgi:hypothetical protein
MIGAQPNTFGLLCACYIHPSPIYTKIRGEDGRPPTQKSEISGHKNSQISGHFVEK